jgi:hypothetical protein
MPYTFRAVLEPSALVLGRPQLAITGMLIYKRYLDSGENTDSGKVSVILPVWADPLYLGYFLSSLDAYCQTFFCLECVSLCAH